MFEFIEFLRVVSVGLIALGLFGVICCKSVFSMSFSVLLAISALFGLLVQPFLRAYHPFRDQVKDVIRHVERYVREVLVEKPDSRQNHEDTTLENALARAIYEYLYRTVEYSPFFTGRINEQIRFFYFYYFSGLALRIAAIASLIVLFVKIVLGYTKLVSVPVLKVIEQELLLGIENMPCLVIFVAFFASTAWLLSRQFALTAKGIMLTELYTRHVFLAAEKKRIQELARISQDDDTLMQIFREKIDKEKGVVSDK